MPEPGIAPPNGRALTAFVGISSVSVRAADYHCPRKCSYASAAYHDGKALKEQAVCLPDTTLFGDLAFADKQLVESFSQQQTKLITGRKKPKGKELSKIEKYHNRLVSKLRQPIESLFNWINEKTEIQKASKIRSTNGLLIHCWGKLVFAFYLLVFYY